MSFDLSRLPERTRLFLEHGAPEGERQREAFNAACQLRDAGATEAEALSLIEAAAARCGLPLSEARSAVKSAYKRPPREPIRGGNGDKPVKRTIATTYDYTDEKGALLFQCVRYVPKDFKQRRPDADNGWTWNLDGVRRVLFRLPETLRAVQQGLPVFLCEGEKDVLAMAERGLAATCNSGGAGKWRDEYIETLRGASVVVIADKDKAGRDHAAQVASSLHGAAKSVRVIELPEINGQAVKDAADYFAAGGTSDDLIALAESAPEWTPIPLETNTKRNGLLIINAMELLETTFPKSEDIVEGILPQKAKLIVSGPAKLGKSRFTLGLAVGIATGRNVMGFTIKRPRRVLFFQAEVSPRSLQDRLKKMLAAFPAEERPEIEKLVRENLLLCNDPRLKLTHADAVAAIREAVALHKPEVVVFDPLYKYNTGDESAVQDMTRFFDPLDLLIADYGAAVLLVHHHGKGSGDGLATPAHRNRGSSTIADWADSLLTLTFEDADAGVVKLAFTLRNAEEPEPMAFQRNPDTLWIDPLPDYAFPTKGAATRITNEDVVNALGSGREVEYSRFAKELAAKFAVCERTAKSAIGRAAKAGAIVKKGSGLYAAA